jgi:hypothetical protein
MTRKQILDALLPLSGARRLQWLIALGWEMTLSARAGYPAVENNFAHVVAFNEMQHQLYNYMLHSQDQDDWKIEDFLEGLHSELWHLASKATSVRL